MRVDKELPEDWHQDQPIVFSTDPGAIPQLAELEVPQPPLAAPLRERLVSTVMVCAIDGSRVKGVVKSVSEDGTLAHLWNGDDYFFDVAALVLVRVDNPSGETGRKSGRD